MKKLKTVIKFILAIEYFGINLYVLSSNEYPKNLLIASFVSGIGLFLSIILKQNDKSKQADSEIIDQIDH